VALDAPEPGESAADTNSDQVHPTVLKLFDRVAERLMYRIATDRQLRGQRVQQRGRLRITGMHRHGEKAGQCVIHGLETLTDRAGRNVQPG
jgi:hypothetical protein